MAVAALDVSALQGFAGLTMIFGGLAALHLPSAFVVTGALLFLDSIRPEPVTMPPQDTTAK